MAARQKGPAMPKQVVMLGNDLPTQGEVDALNRGGDLVWPGGMALIAYVGARISGFPGWPSYLAAVAGVVVGMKMAKAQRQNLSDEPVA